MDKFQRAYAFHRLLQSRKTSVSKEELCEALDCSWETVKRLIHDLRLYMNAPITNHCNGTYSYSGKVSFELPGVWFSAEELHALLTMQQLAAGLSGGFLEQEMVRLRQRIEAILHQSAPESVEQMQRIRVLEAGKRSKDLPHFRQLATAVLQRKRLQIRYTGRSRGEVTQREVSPQRLAHYRGNWYLDVWCHQAQGFRSFAVERIGDAKLLNKNSKAISEARLNQHFASSFGIFGGQPTATAVLRFTAKAAAWVADEAWFPDAQGEWLQDGCFELHIPYNNPTELIMEICRHGPDVEVVAPAELRQQVQMRLQQAADQYGNGEQT